MSISSIIVGGKEYSEPAEAISIYLESKALLDAGVLRDECVDELQELSDWLLREIVKYQTLNDDAKEDFYEVNMFNIIDEIQNGYTRPMEIYVPLHFKGSCSSLPVKVS